MKDNQMKQADFEELATRLKYDISKYENYEAENPYSTLATRSLFWAISDYTAKLTNSQVSEPKYQWEYKIDGSDEIFTTELMTNEEFRVFHIDKLIHFERIGSEIPAPTTTPQEAISPAIAEYIKSLENGLRNAINAQMYKDWTDEYALKMKIAEESLKAIKPTGLE